MKKKPNVADGLAQKEVDRLDAEFNAKEKQMSEMTQDAMKDAPLKELAPQVKISKEALEKTDAPKIVPCLTRAANGKKKSEQDALRKRAWEYIKVIAENNEVIGEDIEFWHKPMIAGEDLHFWKIPVNKPIYVPRHIAEHIRSRKYHRLKTDENIRVETNQFGDMMGRMIATETRQRLDCRVAGFEI